MILIYMSILNTLVKKIVILIYWLEEKDLKILLFMEEHYTPSLLLVDY